MNRKAALRRKARKRSLALLLKVELRLIRRRRALRGADVNAPLAGLALSGDGAAGAAFSLGVASALRQQRVFGRFDYLSGVSGGALAAACMVWFARLRPPEAQAPPEGSALLSPEALKYIREHAPFMESAHFRNRRNRHGSHVERERGLGAMVLRSTAISLFVYGSLLVGLFFLLDRLDAVVQLTKPVLRLFSVRPPWSSIVNQLNFGLLAGAVLLLLAMLVSVFGSSPSQLWSAWQRSGGRAPPVPWGRAAWGAFWLLLMLVSGLFMIGIIFGRSGWVARVVWLVPLSALSVIAFVRWQGSWSFGSGPLWRRSEKRLARELRRSASWLDERFGVWSKQLHGPLGQRLEEWHRRLKPVLQAERAPRRRRWWRKLDWLLSTNFLSPDGLPSPGAQGAQRAHAGLAVLLGLLPTAILVGLIQHYVFVSGVHEPATPPALDGVAGLALLYFTVVYIALLLPRAFRRLRAFCFTLLSGVQRAEEMAAKQSEARRQHRFGWLLRWSGRAFVFGTVPIAAGSLDWVFPRPELRLAAIALFVTVGVLFVVQSAPPPIGRMPGSLHGARSAWAALVGGLALMYGTLLLAHLFVSAGLGSSVPWVVCVLPVVGVMLGVLHDVNQASPGAAYRDRLADAFLPDEQAVRRGHWQPAVSAANFSLTRAGHASGVPYPLFNAAVHITRSNDARLQRYGADNFVLSPLFCGSEATRYVNTRHWARGDVSLSQVAGICTAAISPLTLGAAASTLRRRLFAEALSWLNLRLSYWAANPRFCSRHSQRRGGLTKPNFLRPLLTSMLGRGLSERQKHVELADGTQFEALGLYELVRRRVQFIVVVDATRDSDGDFGELTRSLQLIRSELGVEIEIPLQAFVDTHEEGQPYHFSIGRMRYPEQPEPCPIVYFKAPPLGARSRPRADAAQTPIDDDPAHLFGGEEFGEQFLAGTRAGKVAEAALERLATETLASAG
jgi:hypothetical protein